MRRTFSIAITVILLLLSDRSPGQRVYDDSQPLGIGNIELRDYWYELAFDNYTLDSLALVSTSRNYPFRFGISEQVELNIQNSGLLVDKGSELIWYLPIRSTGAKSLNVIFSRFNLSEGDRLYIYTTSFGLIRGPFTSENNNTNSILATVPVNGDELIIEFHFQRGSKSLLEVGQISHDYVGIINSSGGLKEKALELSGPCNIDINCSLGADWQVEKRSVVRIYVDGIYLGTGAMINNSNQENIPYILTAEHVLNNEFDASRSIYLFGYERPWCDGVDGSLEKSISGSNIVATNGEIDLALVKLSSFPPITYKPYLAGWDRRSIISQNQTTIHHPDGDVKKISVDLDPPVISTFEGRLANGFWKIVQWDYGTTEGGSSVAPLFNQDHRIIGYLTGGEAFCGNSVNDYFARFDVAYDLSPDMFKSLNRWLDPAQSGLMIMDGRDPYENNFITADTLSNITSGDTLITKYDLPATGYTTGFNSDSIIAYAEAFKNTGSKYLTEINAYVGKRNYLLPADSVTFYLFEGGGTPGLVLASRKINIRDSQDTFQLNIDFKMPVNVTDDFFVGYRLWYKDEANSEAQQFSLFHSSEVPAVENTAYFLDSSGWRPFTEHPYDPSGRHLYLSAILVTDPVYNTINSVSPEIATSIYPNPFINHITVKNSNPGDEIFTITLYTLQGNICRHYANGSGSEIIIEGLEELTPGVYFLEIKGDGWEEVHKIIKQN